MPGNARAVSPRPVLNPRPFRKRRNPLVLLLMRRGLSFFTLMSFLMVFLYLVGVLRQFTESTQLMLLRLTAFFGLSLGITGVVGVALDLFFLIRDRRFYSGGKCAVAAAVGLLGFVLAVSAVFILALTGGNIQ